jgi:hypothetical protein
MILQIIQHRHGSQHKQLEHIIEQWHNSDLLMQSLTKKKWLYESYRLNAKKSMGATLLHRSIDARHQNGSI